MKMLYKVLNRDLVSPFEAFQYRLGKEYRCENFDSNPVRDCSHGFYAVEIEGLPYCYTTNRSIVLCKVYGREVELNQFKRRYEFIKPIRIVTPKEIQEKIVNGNLNEKVGYNIYNVLFPVDPFMIKAKEVTSVEIELFNRWIEIIDPIIYDFLDAIKYSVFDSIMESDLREIGFWALDSIRGSLGDSIVGHFSFNKSLYAYISSLFPSIKVWKKFENVTGNPFQPAIDLWHLGFVPGFDGEEWNLYNKNGIAYIKGE